MLKYFSLVSKENGSNVFDRENISAFQKLLTGQTNGIPPN